MKLAGQIKSTALLVLPLRLRMQLDFFLPDGLLTELVQGSVILFTWVYGRLLPRLMLWRVRRLVLVWLVLDWALENPATFLLLLKQLPSGFPKKNGRWLPEYSTQALMSVQFLPLYWFHGFH